MVTTGGGLGPGGDRCPDPTADAPACRHGPCSVLAHRRPGSAAGTPSCFVPDLSDDSRTLSTLSCKAVTAPTTGPPVLSPHSVRPFYRFLDDHPCPSSAEPQALASTQTCVVAGGCHLRRTAGRAAGDCRRGQGRKPTLVDADRYPFGADAGKDCASLRLAGRQLRPGDFAPTTTYAPEKSLNPSPTPIRRQTLSRAAPFAMTLLAEAWGSPAPLPAWLSGADSFDRLPASLAGPAVLGHEPLAIPGSRHASVEMRPGLRGTSSCGFTRALKFFGIPSHRLAREPAGYAGLLKHVCRHRTRGSAQTSRCRRCRRGVP